MATPDPNPLKQTTSLQFSFNEVCYIDLEIWPMTGLWLLMGRMFRHVFTFCSDSTQLEMCPPFQVTHGHVDRKDGVSFKGTVRVTCEPGYTLRGQETHTCSTDGKWEGVHTECIGRYDSLYECDKRK